MCAITGRSRTGTIGLGSSNVRGRRRVPRPAARTIAFMRRRTLANALRALLPGGQVRLLVLGERVDLDAERGEREPRDLVVDLARDAVDARRQLAGPPDEVLGGERLVGE